jgi:hypothetical protein
MTEQIFRECNLPGCSNTFSIGTGKDKRRSERKYCSTTCGSQSRPEYIRNTKLIEECELYISLGFTTEQVYQDFIEGNMKLSSWIRLIERRGSASMARRFRAYEIAIGESRWPVVRAAA